METPTPTPEVPATIAEAPAATAEAPATTAEAPAATASPEAKSSYVKLAMRNMVRKKGTSLKHFFLTTFALLGMLIGLSYLTR